MMRLSACGIYLCVIMMCGWLIPIATSRDQSAGGQEKCEHVEEHADRCAFVHRACGDVAQNINYLQAYYCSPFISSSVTSWGISPTIMSIAMKSFFVSCMCVWLCVLLSLLGTTADVFFVDQLEFMSRRFRLSDDVAGATLMAFGNGAPDVFTNWNAIESASDASLVLAELLGACMFITTVVLGFVILVAHKAGGRRRSGSTANGSSRGIPSACEVDPLPFARDTVSLAICVFSLCACVLDGRIQLIESIAVLVLYACYLLVVIGSRPGALAGISCCLLAGGVRTGLTSGNSPTTAATTSGGSISPSIEAGESAISMIETRLPARSSSHTGSVRGRSSSIDGNTIDTKSSSVEMRRNSSHEYYQAVTTDEDHNDSDHSRDSMSSSEWPSRRHNPHGVGTRQRPELSLRGVHWSATNSPLSKVIHVIEYPFSLIRHVTIPAATFEPLWGPARRRVAVAATAGSTLVLAFELVGPAALFEATSTHLPIPLGIYILLLGFLAGFLIFKATTDNDPPSLPLKTLLVIIGFLSAVAWLDLLASETCAVLESLGAASGVSSAVLGVTALSWGNCIGDLVADTAVARAGNSKAAVASIFNSPLFSQVLSLGFPVTYYTMTHGPLSISIDAEAVLSFAGVAFSLGLTTTVCAMSGASLPRRYAFVLFAIYAIYMIFSLFLALRAANIRAEEEGIMVGATSAPQSNSRRWRRRRRLSI